MTNYLQFIVYAFFFKQRWTSWKLSTIKGKLIGHLTCTFPTLVQIYNILYVDLPLFPGSWPTIVLFTVALTEAHLGAVQTQSHANLLVPFWSFFTFLPIPFPTWPSTSLPLCLIWCNYVPVGGNVKYLTHFVVRGQYSLADGPSPHGPQCMQISIQSRPGCFQYNTSAAGPVLIPLYQQPMHCFIQSNALSAMSTWTSGHITEPKNPARAGLEESVFMEG